MTPAPYEPQQQPKRYSVVAIVLHWLLALVLLAMFVVGIYMTDLPFSPLRLKLYNWHKWAGISFLALTVLRLLWRATHRPPPLPTVIEKNKLITRPVTCDGKGSFGEALPTAATLRFFDDVIGSSRKPLAV